MLFGFYESSGVFQILKSIASLKLTAKSLPLKIGGPWGLKSGSSSRKKNCLPNSQPAMIFQGRQTCWLVLRGIGIHSGDGWMYPYQRTPMGNPYISPISRGYLWVFSSPREHQLDTVRVDVRERGTPNCQLWITPPKFNSSPLKMVVGRRSFPIRKANFQGLC